MWILYPSYNGRTENIYWNDGMLEKWNIGLQEIKDYIDVFSIKPIIPVFHCSNIPTEGE